MLNVLINVHDNINTDKYTILILLNFKKAFDTLCHSTLLKKLEHHEIRDKAIKLLKSFLTNRMQYVACQELRTNVTINKFGVHQGSNLEPLLFQTYVNHLHLPNALPSLPRLTADDTCLIIQAASPTIIQKKN